MTHVINALGRRKSTSALGSECFRIGAQFLLAVTLAGETPAQSSEWVLAREQTIYSTPQTPGNQMGTAVSMDGDFLAVGDDQLTPGVVYVYQLAGGNWTYDATLVPPPGQQTFIFGRSISLNGDTLAVGAPGDRTYGSGAGATFVFVRSLSVWNLQAVLFASDAAPLDAFGMSVSCSGDSLLIGAGGNDDLGADSGSAYVFTRSSGIWTEQQKLLTNDGQSGDVFGESVALEGDVAIIGAPYDADQGLETGSVYAFRRAGLLWTQASKLLSPIPHPNDHFGYSVAIDSGTVLIGEPGALALGFPPAGYCFVQAGNNWVFQAKLQPLGPTPAAPSGSAGVSIDVSGDWAVIGVPSADLYGNYPFLASDAGLAFVFERQGVTWTQIGNVTREPIISSTGLGWSVSISGPRFVAGVPGEPYPGGNQTGYGGAIIYHIVAAPEKYCIAKQNSLSCTPISDSRGIPSASVVTGFQLLCTEVRNNEPGFVIYSATGRSTLPFQGGTLCVASPILRAPAQNSYGSPSPAQDCSGVYSLDWSGFAAGMFGGTPPGALRVPGNIVRSQWWGRDPGFQPPNNTMLSDAIEFTICP